MASRTRGVDILSSLVGTIMLPAGVIVVVREGSFAGVVLMLAGMALLVQSLEYFWG